MSASCCLRFQSPSKAVIVYVLGMERFSSKTLLLLTISALALFIIPAAAVRGSPEKGSRVFLQKQLPLTLIVTTPSELSDSTASTFVSGRQALTAVFSRPVIALGSDFGQPTSQMKLPFSLSCGSQLPGKLRWVTTSIARFDPDVDWPTDLDCNLRWSTGLTTYDGAPFVLGDTSPQRKLTSSPLFMWISDVVSETASNLTDRLWTANIGDQIEVPPDGKILLGFSHPVHLGLLQSALKVVEVADRKSGAGTAGGGPVGLAVAPCQSAAPWIMPYMTGSSSSSSSSSSTPPSTLSLDVNTTCAQITIKGQLKPNTAYRMFLPRGARYHALAGAVQSDLEVLFSGLLPFRLPFNANYNNSNYPRTSYRRLDVWLPHGLSEDTPPEALARRIVLCQVTPAASAGGCVPAPFSFSMVSRGRARLSVPSLRPNTQYRISVIADAGVKDGFGQGLEASSMFFWTSDVSYSFAPPRTDYPAAVLEAGVETLDTWPFLTRGVGPNTYYSVVTSIRAWELGGSLSDDRVKALVTKFLMQYGYYGLNNVVSVLGPPTITLAVPPELLSTSPDAPDWTQLTIPLKKAGGSGAPSRALLMTYATNNTASQGGFAAKLLLNTSLSFTVVVSANQLTAWVLDSAAGGAAVAGAVVTVLIRPSDYFTQSDPRLICSCVTDSDGLCTMTHNDTSGGQLTAFASAGGMFAMRDGAGFARVPSQPPQFVGSLVADRLVVVPGDSVKITGFVQLATPSGLQLPPASYAALQVTPNWEAAAAAASGDAAAAAPGRGLLTGATASAAVVGGADAGDVVPTGGIVTATESYSRVGGSSRSRSMSVVLGGSSGFSQPSVLSSQSSSSALPVVINGTTGTFHAEIVVPKDARLQPYILQLAVPSPGTSSAAITLPQPLAGAAELYSWPAVPGASLTITVADPRPPTADLKLSTPAWSPPTSVVSFTATAVSYIGASVSGAALTAVWRTPRASGLLTLTTDAAGRAEGTVDLGALPAANRSEPYDNLSIDVEWIGPTRERITRSATVVLANGPARLDVQLSLDPLLPCTTFTVAATLTSNDDGGKPLTGVPVYVTLRPNDTATGTTAATLCASPTSCTVLSGSPFSPAAACQLALPGVGVFVLEACADVPVAAEEGAGVTQQRVCNRQTLGRNSTDWSTRPLDKHPEPRLITDKTSYTPGDVVKLQLQNPWPGARLLLQWGNDYKSRTKVYGSLSSGLVEVTLGPLADEVRGGGVIIAVLDVPRLRTSQLPPLPPADQLAVSRLFDPYAPHSHVLTATLTMRPENALAVSVAVVEASSGGGGGGGGGDGVRTIRDVDGGEVVALEPGATAEVRVTVKDSLQEDAAVPVAGSVEVTVYGVDKAFLDLLPYDLPHPEQEMVLRLAADMSVFGMNAYRLAPGAVRAVFDKLMARLAGTDPWLEPDTSVQLSNWGVAAVDVPDATYLARYTSALTNTPPNWYYDRRDLAMEDVVMVGSSGPLVAAAGGTVGGAKGGAEMDSSISSISSSNGASGSGGSSSSNEVAVRYESKFVVTPLFATATTDDNGVAKVKFTAPQNLGTFVLRAFAASGSAAHYGSGEGRVAVRRLVSLTPSLPRFVRVGDSFQAGVVVTVAEGLAPADVAVQLQVDGNAVSVNGTTRKTVSFSTSEGGGEDLQEEVRFSFSAASMGSVNLTFTATLEGQRAGDVVQLQLQVHGQQGDVWLATTFALTATPPPPPSSSPASGGTAVQWQEGLTLPDAVPGSGGLNLTAGVGYFPAIAAIYSVLQETDSDRSYASAVPAVLWATLPAVLSYYDQPISSGYLELSSGGLSDLSTLTDPSLGLMWSESTRWYNWRPTRTDLYLNTWALFLAGLYGSTLASTSSPNAAQWSSLESTQLPNWRAAVARQLVADAVQSRQQQYSPGPYSDWYTLAWVRLVLGANWVPPADIASDQIRGDLSLAALVGANKSMSRQARVLTSLVLHSLGTANPAPNLVAGTISEITSLLRVQGRTAYVASAPGLSSAASLEDQALSLLLLLRTGVNHQLLPKLAAYVANPASTDGYGIRSYVSYSWRDQGLAVAALSEYDKTRGSSKPDLALLADVNGLTVLQANFQSGSSTRPVSNMTRWEDIPAPGGQGGGGQGATNNISELNFQVAGRGEVTVSASLHFVPSALLPYPTYRGLFVEAALQLLDPLTDRPTGQRLSSVPLGSVVVLTLQLTSPDDLGPVTLAVMMPGGLEPLDPNTAAGTGGGGGGLGLSCGANWVVTDSAWGGSSFFRGWWWPMCPSQETRPQLVTFFYLALRSGTSSVAVRAVAATPGTFIFPPVRAFADNQPELSGSTAASYITVCADCDRPLFARPLPGPVGCPGECSGRGVCNLRTGRCSCQKGFGRADCSRPVAAAA